MQNSSVSASPLSKMLKLAGLSPELQDMAKPHFDTSAQSTTPGKKKEVRQGGGLHQTPERMEGRRRRRSNPKKEKEKQPSPRSRDRHHNKNKGTSSLPQMNADGISDASDRINTILDFLLEEGVNPIPDRSRTRSRSSSWSSHRRTRSHSSPKRRPAELRTSSLAHSLLSAVPLEKAAQKFGEPRTSGPQRSYEKWADAAPDFYKQLQNLDDKKKLEVMAMLNDSARDMMVRQSTPPSNPKDPVNRQILSSINSAAHELSYIKQYFEQTNGKETLDRTLDRRRPAYRQLEDSPDFEKYTNLHRTGSRYNEDPAKTKFTDPKTKKHGRKYHEQQLPLDQVQTVDDWHSQPLRRSYTEAEVQTEKDPNQRGYSENNRAKYKTVPLQKSERTHPRYHHDRGLDNPADSIDFKSHSFSQVAEQSPDHLSFEDSERLKRSLTSENWHGSGPQSLVEGEDYATFKGQYDGPPYHRKHGYQQRHNPQHPKKFADDDELEGAKEGDWYVEHDGASMKDIRNLADQLIRKGESQRNDDWANEFEELGDDFEEGFDAEDILQKADALGISRTNPRNNTTRSSLPAPSFAVDSSPIPHRHTTSASDIKALLKDTPWLGERLESTPQQRSSRKTLPDSSGKQRSRSLPRTATQRSRREFRLTPQQKQAFARHEQTHWTEMEKLLGPIKFSQMYEEMKNMWPRQRYMVEREQRNRERRKKGAATPTTCSIVRKKYNDQYYEAVLKKRMSKFAPSMPKGDPLTVKQNLQKLQNIRTLKKFVMKNALGYEGSWTIC